MSLQEFISHPYAYNLANSRQWGKLAKALLRSIATYSHFLVIINGFFPLLDHSCICCLAAVYAPEAWKKFGKNISKYESIWELKTFLNTLDTAVSMVTGL